MKKFAFIGAGSFVFTRNLTRDLLCHEAFRDCEIALMDINEDRLRYIKQAVDKINAAMGNTARVTATLSRDEALDGADGVLCTVFNGDLDVFEKEMEIPKAFGIDINIGDTRSVPGLFRSLRNIPLLLDICKSIEAHCPKALFLNYTNPMATLCKAMQTYTKVNVTGLCHSVQGTAQMLAGWLGYTLEEIDYRVAGINHQAWFLELSHAGEDLTPRLKAFLQAEENYRKEKVRNEMFLQLGFYPTESSGHNSEYNYWFRKRPELIEKYCSPCAESNWNPGVYGLSLEGRRRLAAGGAMEKGNCRLDRKRRNRRTQELGIRQRHLQRLFWRRPFPL